jgi:hypothetical protein
VGTATAVVLRRCEIGAVQTNPLVRLDDEPLSGVISIRPQRVNQVVGCLGLLIGGCGLRVQNVKANVSLDHLGHESVHGTACGNLMQHLGAFGTIPLRIFDRNQGEKARTLLDITRNQRATRGAFGRQELQDLSHAGILCSGTVMAPCNCGFRESEDLLADVTALPRPSRRRKGECR